MSCSVCRRSVLHSFIYVYGSQHVKAIPRHISKTCQQKAIHSGPVLHLRSTSVNSTASGANAANPIASFDNSYIPFATSSASTKTTQFTLSSSVRPRRRSPVGADIQEQIQGAEYFAEDVGQIESDMNEPDPTLFTESKSRRLVGNAAKSETSPSGRRIARNRRVRSYGQDERKLSDRRVPSTIRERGRTVARFPTENTKAGKMPRNPQELWGVQKAALEQKFGDRGWVPRKRLSPDALDGIRVLHAKYPENYTTAVLAEQFKVSPEAIRRILKSKWRPNDEEDVSRRQRWQKRGEAIWSQMVELGVKPPKKWRDMGIGRIHDLHAEREKPRRRPQSTDWGENPNAVADDLIEAPLAMAQANELVRRSLSDRIL